MKEACRLIIKKLMQIPDATREDVNRVKIEVCRELRARRILKNSEIIRHLEPQERAVLISILRRKIVRTISGVAVVAVMTKPWPCPHGKCSYCPGGPPYGVPQSYTGHEPATMRGLQYGFDPYRQVRGRIEQLQAIGHEVDKIELIVMGGTFPAMPVKYQESFIKGCLDAITGIESLDLEEAKRNAEVGKFKNVGITVETRPDWAKESHVDHLLEMGVTRVELGVQNIYDDVYTLVKRGHSVRDVIEATRILKDAGIKVCYHMMPGLPSSDYKRDLEAFQKIFTDSCFKPDMIKVYPCLVLGGTEVYQWWLDGKYKPYSTEEAVRIVMDVIRMIPRWVRIMRIQRDIPAQLVVDGVKRSNLHQIVLRRLKKQGLICHCIRCREIGHRMIRDKVKPNPDNIRLLTQNYEASEGIEVFISIEDPIRDILIGFLRLRIPSEKAHRPEIKSGIASIIREMHVYGPLVPVGRHFARAWQHKGYGEVLLSEAERISMEDYDCRKVLVTSALGTKRYYMRFGYKHDGPYLSKAL